MVDKLDCRKCNMPPCNHRGKDSISRCEIYKMRDVNDGQYFCSVKHNCKLPERAVFNK